MTELVRSSRKMEAAFPSTRSLSLPACMGTILWLSARRALLF
jgi:hypothetical protein